MGKALITKLAPVVEKIDWPQNGRATLKGQHIYEVAIEKIESAPHHPNSYLSALRTLQTSDSRPYAYAGVAYALVFASGQGRGPHDPDGLRLAMTWLGKAQDDEPDIVEINVIEVLIYIFLERFSDARTVLHYLHQQEEQNFDLIKAEIIFWRQMQDVEQTVEWSEKGIKAAKTVPQRLRLRQALGDFYLDVDRPEEALTIYQEAVHFSKNNPQLWHRMSVAYWRLGDYPEAKRHNQKALQLKDFSAARKMEAALRKKLGPTGLLGRFFGS